MPMFLRRLAVLLLLVSPLCLGACGGDEPAPAPEPREPVYENALARIQATGKLVVGVSDDLPPFGYKEGENGEPHGFDVDMARAVAKALGVTPEFEVLAPARRLPALTSGRVDMVAAGLEQTARREESVDFSLPVFMDGQKLMVHREYGINGIRDLNGLSVAAVQDSGDAQRLAGAVPGKLVVKPYSGYVKAFLALKSGEVQALTADATILLRLRATDVRPELWKITGAFLSHKPYALALPENQSDLRDAVNQALAEMKASGEFARIHETWFGPDSEHPMPMELGVWAWPEAGS